MSKHFLLIAGDNYYPCAGDGDWINRFKTRDEAEQLVVDSGREYSYGRYKITVNGKVKNFDWYKVINLETWELSNP